MRIYYTCHSQSLIPFLYPGTNIHFIMHFMKQPFFSIIVFACIFTLNINAKTDFDEMVSKPPIENEQSCPFIPSYQIDIPDDYHKYCGGIIKSGFDQGINVVYNGQMYIQRTVVISHHKNSHICLDLSVENNKEGTLYETEPVIISISKDTHVIDISRTLPRAYNLRVRQHADKKTASTFENECLWLYQAQVGERDSMDSVHHFARQLYVVHSWRNYFDSFYWMNRGDHLFALSTNSRTSTIDYQLNFPKRNLTYNLPLTEGSNVLNMNDTSLFAAPVLVDVHTNGHEGHSKVDLVAAPCNLNYIWRGFELLDKYCLYTEPESFWTRFWSPSLDFDHERDKLISQGQPCIAPRNINVDPDIWIKAGDRNAARTKLIDRPRGEISDLRPYAANAEFEEVAFHTDGVNDRIIARGSHHYTYETTLQLRSRVVRQHVQEGIVTHFNCTPTITNSSLICQVNQIARLGNVRFQLYANSSCNVLWSRLVRVTGLPNVFDIPINAGGLETERDYRICTPHGLCTQVLLTLHPDKPYYAPPPTHHDTSRGNTNLWKTICNFISDLWKRLKTLWILLLGLAALILVFFVCRSVCKCTQKKSKRLDSI